MVDVALLGLLYTVVINYEMLDLFVVAYSISYDYDDGLRPTTHHRAVLFAFEY